MLQDRREREGVRYCLEYYRPAFGAVISLWRTRPLLSRLHKSLEQRDE
jgi:hypothetical protein